MRSLSDQSTLTRVVLKTTQCLGLLALTTGILLTPPAVRGQTLGQALNATDLTWTTTGTGGSFGWLSETSTTHDGASAADSGRLSSSSGTSTLQTTVNGPGTITFWWSNPSSASRLDFVVNGVTQAFISFSGSTWLQRTFYLGPGSQTLKWVFSVVLPPADSSHSYVDQVSYTPGAVAPRIPSQPISQSQVPNLNATFTVGAEGTPPLYYQWQFNGTNISGATTSACTLTNVQPGSLGNYSVVVTNSVDSIGSSNATLEFGQITSWGSPAYGDTTVATGATNVLAAAGGDSFSLSLNADGTMRGWGWNVKGQTTVPADLTNVIAVAAGTSHTLALRADGTVAAWGGQNLGETNVPDGLSNVVAIAAGLSPHSVALKSDGTVAAWGGVLQEKNVPAGLTNVVAIAAGSGYDLALKADGTVTTWGSQAPTLPSSLTNVVAIAVGSAHRLALLANGTVFAWGSNTYGQTNVPAGLSNVVAIAAGSTHSLALVSDGTVVAWGHNNYSQTNVPTGLTNVIAISAGTDHSLAIVGSIPPLLGAAAMNPTLSGNGFNLSLPSQSGRVYALEYKDHLSDSNWVSLPLAAGTGANLVFTDPAATNAQRFYQIRRW